MKWMMLLPLGLFFVVACKKEKVAAEEDPIVGKWDWAGAKTWGVTVTPQMINKTWSLTFNADGSCTQSGTLLPVMSANYRMPNDSLLITYTDNTVARFSYRYLSHDSLELDAGSFVDGSIHMFVRK